MEDSILVSIKKLLGLGVEYTPFDPDIIMHINSALMAMNQLGIGPAEPFFITGAGETWSEFVDRNVEAVKTAIFIRVKIVFDPPSSSFALEALKEQLKEYEWRLNVQVDPKEA